MCMCIHMYICKAYDCNIMMEQWMWPQSSKLLHLNFFWLLFIITDLHYFQKVDLFIQNTAFFFTNEHLCLLIGRVFIFIVSLFSAGHLLSCIMLFQYSQFSTLSAYQNHLKSFLGRKKKKPRSGLLTFLFNNLWQSTDYWYIIKFSVSCLSHKLGLYPQCTVQYLEPFNNLIVK